MRAYTLYVFRRIDRSILEHSYHPASIAERQRSSRRFSAFIFLSWNNNVADLNASYICGNNIRISFFFIINEIQRVSVLIEAKYVA